MKRGKLIEIIATELLGVVPIHEGPFVSQAEARRCANYDNNKRFEVAERFADAILTEPECEHEMKMKNSENGIYAYCTKCGESDSPPSEAVKIHLTQFVDFLLKEGYCDTDVYTEPPTAIDQYLSGLNK